MLFYLSVLPSANHKQEYQDTVTNPASVSIQDLVKAMIQQMLPAKPPGDLELQLTEQRMKIPIDFLLLPDSNPCTMTLMLKPVRYQTIRTVV